VPAPQEPGSQESAPQEPRSQESGSPELGSQEPDVEEQEAKGPVPGTGEPEFDEQAAWEAIVAGYGEEPPDPPGAKPFKPIENLALLEPDESNDGWDGTGGRPRRERAPSNAKDAKDAKDAADAGDAKNTADTDADTEKPKGGPDRPLGGSVAFAPGVGPRDYRPPQPSEGDFDQDDEGHFVPPDPPPLPSADATATFGWLAVLGGPLLLLLAVLLGWQMTWWLTTLGIGGFIGGFVTLVIRMNPGDEDDDDPGRGAVV
jgi:hypothetical protein